MRSLREKPFNLRSPMKPGKTRIRSAAASMSPFFEKTARSSGLAARERATRWTKLRHGGEIPVDCRALLHAASKKDPGSCALGGFRGDAPTGVQRGRDLAV